MGFADHFDWKTYKQGNDGKTRPTYCVCLDPPPASARRAVTFTDQPRWEMYRLKAADKLGADGARFGACCSLLTKHLSRRNTPPSPCLLPDRPPARLPPARGARHRGPRAPEPRGRLSIHDAFPRMVCQAGDHRAGLHSLGPGACTPSPLLIIPVPLESFVISRMGD